MQERDVDSRVRFESLGCYLPERSTTTADLMAQLKVEPVLDVERFTGIRSRHVRAEDEDTLTMSLAAARDCLSRSRYEASDLDVVISGAITRVRGHAQYYLEPAMSLWIKDGLGARQAMHFDVSNACAGMFTGVYLLESLIRTGVVRNGMVVSGECNTAISDTAVREIDSPIDEQLASLTVGDAAAAVILDGDATEEDRLDFIEMLSCTEAAHLCLGKPSERSAGIALYTKNSSLHSGDNLRLWPYFLAKTLERRGSSFEAEGFDHLVPHQLGLRFTQKSVGVAEEALGAEMPPAIHVLETCANTSSTTHFVALYEALRDGRVDAGDKLLFFPAASGIVTGAVAATVSRMGL